MSATSVKAMENRKEIEILTEDDIVTARSAGRQIAEALGFMLMDCTQVATVISELARNIILYAGQGAITISILRNTENPRGMEIVATDSGPGIEDLNIVMQDGYSTSRGLGLGLPGSKRLMDEFELQSEPGRGTKVKVIKWLVA